MKTFKLFLSLDREERWLEEMARQGWLLVHKGWRYRFKRIPAQDLTVRIDYRTFKRREDYEDYLELFSDCGWQHLAGKKGSGTQVFCAQGEPDGVCIFSDQASKRARSERYARSFLTAALLWLPMLAALVRSGSIDLSVLWVPQRLYLTPGLWDRAGVSFWSAFLFETPFALLRAAGILFFPVAICLFVLFYFRARKVD